MKPHTKQSMLHKSQHMKKQKRKLNSSSLTVKDLSKPVKALNPHTAKKQKTAKSSLNEEFLPVSPNISDLEKKQNTLSRVEGKRRLQLLQANKEEDKIISKLEKVLGVKKRRRKKKQSNQKIPSVFTDDGLDYILEVLGSHETKEEDSVLKNDSRKDSVPNDDSDDEISHDDSDGEKEQASNDDCDDEDDNVSNGDFDSNECSESEEENIVVKKEKPEIWEDIYGRLRDSEGNILPSSGNTTQAYVPPHERAKQEVNSGKPNANLERVKRQLKGLINRLAESNVNRIGNEIEQMYMKNSRNDMNETLISILSEVMLLPVPIPPRFAIEQAMLIALLHSNIGSEIGAFFLQYLTLKLDELLKNKRNSEEGKECNNLLVFLCHLYNFKVTSSMLIFDILRLLIESFQEIDIELILVVLKYAGFTLRKDDPLIFKEILLSAQSKATTLKPEQNQSRVNFMLDILIEVRNNNMDKMKRLLSYDPSIADHMRKVLRGLVHKGSYVQELSISYDDLLKAHEKGRWWIVGSAWSERTTESTLDSQSSESMTNSVSDKILKLAKKLHINTEIRKSVFSAIMTAQDYLDAFESLLRLNLKNQQEREIISVLLHCSLAERNFNPYYAHLAAKFCKHERKFSMHLKFSLWDKFKELESLKPSQRDSLASLLVHLFTTEAMDISVLKVIHFSEIDKTKAQFFRKILTAVLLHDSEEFCRKVFQRIAFNSNLQMLRESLRLFMHHFILRRKSQVDSTVSEKLAKRVKIAEESLNSAKHAFKL